jgi:HSP20 family protein
MANIVKKDGGQNPPQQQGGGPLQRQQGGSQNVRGDLMRRDPFSQLLRDPFMLLRDPFQVMREMMMMDPFRVMQGAGMGREVMINPAFDIRETDDAIVFKADMPGIREEDLELSLIGNQLQISGKREHEQEQDEEGRFHTVERSYGTFVRSFSLPEVVDLDNVRSELKNGELTIVVPKKPGTQPQRRKIQIGSGSRS